jgi:hypothetical protein
LVKRGRRVKDLFEFLEWTKDVESQERGRRGLGGGEQREEWNGWRKKELPW